MTMAKVRLVGTFPIRSGSFGDASVESCCYIPGSSGFDSANFGINASVLLAVTDQNEVYIALNGGNAGHTGNALTKGPYPWVMYWGHSIHSFTITSVSGLPNSQQLGNMSASPDPGSGANANFDFPATTAPSKGDDASVLSGWHHVGNVADLESDSQTYFYLYVAFPVRNTMGEENFDAITAYRVAINDPSIVPEIFDYYPWGRYIDGTWKSHNRSGGSLKRHNGSSWKDVKNTYGSSANSRGFRHNGSTWAVSPVTGEE